MQRALTRQLALGGKVFGIRLRARQADEVTLDGGAGGHGRQYEIYRQQPGQGTCEAVHGCDPETEPILTGGCGKRPQLRLHVKSTLSGELRQATLLGMFSGKILM